MNLVKVDSTKLDDVKRRVIKFLRLGKSDVQTSLEIAPYGIDSNPIKDMVALYSPTGENGKTCIIGYINKNLKAEPGEFRTFATDDQGNERFYTWMKKDGTIEIGGDTDNAVKYSELEKAFNQLKQDFNALVLSFNTHQHTCPPGGGPTTGAQTASTSSADISPAKHDKIKTL